MPHVRDCRDEFRARLAETGLLTTEATMRLLCVHQAFEGAVVGPSGYTFRRGRDVVPCRYIPEGLAAVVSGHIHRAQVIVNDLAGRPLAAPIVFPGSVERTSFAERDEEKTYVTLSLDGNASNRPIKGVAFHRLPARPMCDLLVDASGLGRSEFESVVRRRIDSIPRDAVARIRLLGADPQALFPACTDSWLRLIAPRTMNVSYTWSQQGSEARSSWTWRAL
jgi:DNA repair exonuclease SbcCD nuclease subunit